MQGDVAGPDEVVGGVRGAAYRLGGGLGDRGL
jgi:hypothetical protein